LAAVVAAQQSWLNVIKTITATSHGDTCQAAAMGHHVFCFNFIFIFILTLILISSCCSVFISEKKEIISLNQNILPQPPSCIYTNTNTVLGCRWAAKSGPVLNFFSCAS